jgi:hypothetical protein
MPRRMQVLDVENVLSCSRFLSWYLCLKSRKILIGFEYFYPIEYQNQNHDNELSWSCRKSKGNCN